MNLTDPIFTNEEAARRHFKESLAERSLLSALRID